MLGLFPRKLGSGKRSRLKASYDRYQLNPGETESLAVARRLLRAERLDDAFRWIHKARTHFPNSEKVDAFYRKVKRTKARAWLAEALERAKRNPNAANRVRVCELLRLSGAWKKSYTASRKVQRQFPDNWEIHFGLGRLFFERFSTTRRKRHGRTTVKHLEKSLELNPGEYQSLLLLSTVFVRLGEFDQAVDVIEEMLEISPGNAKATALLSLVRKLAPECVRNGRTATGDHGSADPLEHVMGIPGAVGAFLFDDKGDVRDTLSRENDTFDFSAPAETARMCRLETDRLGLGELVFYTLRGEGWNIGYRRIYGGSVLAFFEGEVSEEQIAVDMESVLGEICVATA